VKTIYNKILLAMDDSEDSLRAAKKVIDLVKNGECIEDKQKINHASPEIVAFHSIDHNMFPKFMPIPVASGFGPRYSIPAVDYRKLEEEYRVHGKKILNKTKELFEKENIDIETRLIEDEKPEEYIENAVEKEDYDLIALGSKGEHSKLEQIFTESVAQKVLNDIQCDILVVR
jgi:nucleotide-binding universal stress UspA family protein